MQRYAGCGGKAHRRRAKVKVVHSTNNNCFRNTKSVVVFVQYFGIFGRRMSTFFGDAAVQNKHYAPFRTVVSLLDA